MYAIGTSSPAIFHSLRDECGITYANVLKTLHDAGVVRTRSDASKNSNHTTTRQCKHCGESFTIMNAAQVFCRVCCPTKRAYARLKYYGLSEPEFHALWQLQNGVCVLCSTPLIDAGSTNMNVDHCHSTGRVRGLLCHRCNMIVGLIDKNENITAMLSKIDAYLVTPEKKYE